MFDLLNLTGTQDWMTIPANLRDNFLDFRKFKEFAENISVCNDIAERGMALITIFINKVQSIQMNELAWLIENVFTYFQTT